MAIILNSKKRATGNNDLWWFNLSSPDLHIKPEEKIIFNMFDESNASKIGKITLKLNEDNWYRRIIEASRHNYRGTEITKVHVLKKQGSTQYYIYFGKKEDGYYPVTV